MFPPRSTGFQRPHGRGIMLQVTTYFRSVQIFKLQICTIGHILNSPPMANGGQILHLDLFCNRAVEAVLRCCNAPLPFRSFRQLTPNTLMAGIGVRLRRSTRTVSPVIVTPGTSHSVTKSCVIFRHNVKFANNAGARHILITILGWSFLECHLRIDISMPIERSHPHSFDYSKFPFQIIRQCLYGSCKSNDLCIDVM